jgi:putative FmdB family regulatory protein
MPTYEYECTKCGEKFDVFQSIKARPLRRAECAGCGVARPVRRLVSAGGAVIFKGSGFYQTDYRSEGYKKAAKAETPTGGDSTASNSASGNAASSGSTSSADDKGAARTSAPCGGGKDAATTGEPKPSKKPPAPKTTEAV